jgi:hypothetical protein
VFILIQHQTLIQIPYIALVGNIYITLSYAFFKRFFVLNYKQVQTQ